jgi:hypothetical protein
MPVLRYFMFVGAALLALLFVVGAELPSSPAVEAANGAPDLSTIRIHSDRKWPERVVFDTSAPRIVPAPTQTASLAPVTAKPDRVADVSTKVTARDAFAQLTPADLKKPEAKPVQKRKVAKRHVNPPTTNQPTMLVAQRPQPFGLFANNIW